MHQPTYIATPDTINGQTVAIVEAPEYDEQYLQSLREKASWNIDTTPEQWVREIRGSEEE
jgi:hypothetical protein